MVRPSTGALLAAASATAYGSLGVLAKLAYGEGWNVPSLLAVRFLVAALVVLPFIGRGGSWRGVWGGFAVGAIGYAGTTAFYFPSLRLLPAAVASFLLFLAPALIALLSRIFLKERLGWRGTVALALALAGLTTIASGALVGALPMVGVLLAVGSAVAYSFTVMAGRIVVRDLTWARAAVATSVGAASSYLVIALVSGNLVIPKSPPGIAYALGIGTLATGVALSLFYAALPRIGASRTALVSTLEPVSTLIFAAIVLSEAPALRSLIGGALILGAAALVALEQEKTIVEPTPTAP